MIVKGWFAIRFGSQEEIDKIQSKGLCLLDDKLIQATQWLFFSFHVEEKRKPFSAYCLCMKMMSTWSHKWNPERVTVPITLVTE